MKTINNLIKKIRIKINDTSAFEFSDDELLSYIHNGLSSLEMILLSNRVKFNITLLHSPLNTCPVPITKLTGYQFPLLHSPLNTCPVPDDLLEIHKIIIDNMIIPLKNEYDNNFGYFILNNSIVLPNHNADIYYIKEFDRYGVDDEINLPSSYIDYLYLYTVIKALSRLEFNMDKEEKELLQLSNMIIKTTLSKYGSYPLQRDNRFAL